MHSPANTASGKRELSPLSFGNRVWRRIRDDNGRSIATDQSIEITDLGGDDYVRPAFSAQITRDQDGTFSAQLG